ncbi:MAG: VIT domain-containing protein, partial [Gordonia sp. (in: high G+C Gram-positive bacteria)]
MTVHISPMSDIEAAEVTMPADDAGIGALRTERGNLPLAAIDLRADITGLTSRVELTQDFVNTFDVGLEATYIFPLPDRGAVTGMQMTAGDRTVEAQLAERSAAREIYDDAIAAGRRASIAEEERPDVFTLRVGNIVPGETVRIVLTLVVPLAFADDTATFRFPLVVAPRYLPGSPLPGDPVGDGYADDTDAVPDASRISPPVLLPGFPNPVRLSIDVGVDAGALPLADVRSSLHVRTTSPDGRFHLSPGERANRDLVVRLYFESAVVSNSLVLIPDADGDSDGGGDEGTYQLTVLPPTGSTGTTRPRDVVLVLDRSGSMRGWKMVAARRAAARIVDTLTAVDRFTVLTFDHEVSRPDGLPAGLVAATDRHRYRAVEHLARVDAWGGTELATPLTQALSLLEGAAAGRDAVLVLVTDGQVGNEDQILSGLGSIANTCVHTVGIDQAVNAGFLVRLASLGGGRCELVESEDRLDEAMDAIHRRIGTPLAFGLRLDTTAGDAVDLVDDTTAPARLPDLFPGVPLVISGRYRGRAGSLTVRGETPDGAEWSVTAPGRVIDATAAGASAVVARWARAHLRDLEDGYAAR